MSEQAMSGTSAAQRDHRVVRSEDLPRFSIGTPVAVGLIIWLALLLAAIWQHDRLVANGHGWWVWTAVTGVVLGLLGWLYITVRLKDLPGQVVEPEQSQPAEPIQPAPSARPADQ